MEGEGQISKETNVMELGTAPEENRELVVISCFMLDAI